MAKSRKRDFAVSLFPFLSILACVLGVLTLMITSVVLTQIDDESVDQALEQVINQKQEALLKVEEQIKMQKKWLEPVRRDVLKGREIVPLLAQIQKLESQGNPKAKTDAEMHKEIAAMQANNKKLQQKIQAGKSETSQMQKKLEMNTNPAGYATVNVQRSSSALGGTITPIFIECSKDGLSIYNKEGALEYKVPLAQIPKHNQLKQLIQKTARHPQLRVWKSLAGTKIKAVYTERKGIYVVFKEPSGRIHQTIKPESLTPKSRQALTELDKLKKAGKTPSAGQYIIFLVRPEGIFSWAKGRDLCYSMDCHSGKLPIPSQGQINVKSFIN